MKLNDKSCLLKMQKLHLNIVQKGKYFFRDGCHATSTKEAIMY